jgi:hypothetical protein
MHHNHTNTNNSIPTVRASLTAHAKTDIRILVELCSCLSMVKILQPNMPTRSHAVALPNVSLANTFVCPTSICRQATCTTNEVLCAIDEAKMRNLNRESEVYIWDRYPP